MQLLQLHNSFDNKVCIPKDVTIGTSKVMQIVNYNINEITLTARHNDTKLDVYMNPT